MLKCLKALALLVVLIAGGLIAYIYSGLYDVAATRRMASSAIGCSARCGGIPSMHALDGIQVPANLKDPQDGEEGFVPLSRDVRRLPSGAGHGQQRDPCRTESPTARAREARAPYHAR